MKKTIFTKLLLILLVAFFQHTQIIAQEKIDNIVSIKNGKVIVTEVITIEGATKEDLYTEGVISINKLFSKEEIKTQDNNIYLISVVGRLTSNSLMHKQFNLNIQFKDGKYKYEISDIYYIPRGVAADVLSPHSIEENGIIERNPEWKEVVYKDFIGIISTLKKEIKGNTTDW